MELSQLFYFIAALSGIYLGWSCFQIVNNGESFQERRRELVLLGVIMVCSAGLGAYFKSTEQKRQAEGVQVSLQADPVKSKYLGQWKAPRGKASIEIYEENGGLFAKFWQGDIMPLKFQEDGQYYEGSTALGAMPLIIRNDTLQYSQSKYVRPQTQASN